MIETQRIAEILGGTAILGRDVASLEALEVLIRQGLPKRSLRQVVQRAATDTQERRQLLHRIVPEATFKRRRTLNAEESARTERLARVVATAEYVWDDAGEARDFLHSPNAVLEGRKPLEVALTELGARRVEDLLWQLFYGLPA